ncbi:MAG: hypothetical protein Q9227_007146 [Pyrenula ochraceoflavens]
MVYSLTYRRPRYVSSSATSVISEKSEHAESTHSGSSGSSSPYGIPEALSFDKIIAGGTCPPCTTRDFMNFLVYIEHAAENLQFYLWYRDYVQRFSQLPESEKALAPIWTTQQQEQALANQSNTGLKKINADVAALLKGTDFGTKVKIPGDHAPNPFNTPPRTPTGDTQSLAPSTTARTEDSTTLGGKDSYNQIAASAFTDAGQLQPFTIRPFQEEITRIIAIYLADGGSRQLNLSAKERCVLMEALSRTTHPSAFRSVIATVEWSLRHQAHPNFIRWTICNGNRPRVVFARMLGVGGIVGGLACGIILTLSGAGRGWRALSAIAFVIGIATLIAAWKGMCVVLHGMHHRHLRPWELFTDDSDSDSISDPELTVNLKHYSFDSLTSSNSYEDEPWVARYEKRNLVRKVFDREVWIKEPALRQIQDTIFLQAMGGALVISAVAAGVFVALPKGGFF